MVRVSEAPAAEFFADVSRAAAEVGRLWAVIESGGESALSGGGGGGAAKAVSDPTAGKACAMLAAVEAARERLPAAEALVGEGLAVIAGVKGRLGQAYGAVLELRYVDGLTWEDVASEMGAGRATCFRWHGVALDYVDSVGLDRARQGAAP